jgi:hypothetical protein
MSVTKAYRTEEGLVPLIDRDDIRRILLAVVIMAAFALVEVGVFWFTTQGPPSSVGSPPIGDRAAERFDDIHSFLGPPAYHMTAPGLDASVEWSGRPEAAPTRGASDLMGRGEAKCL